MKKFLAIITLILIAVLLPLLSILLGVRLIIGEINNYFIEVAKEAIATINEDSNWN